MIFDHHTCSRYSYGRKLCMVWVYLIHRAVFNALNVVMCLILIMQCPITFLTKFKKFQLQVNCTIFTFLLIWVVLVVKIKNFRLIQLNLQLYGLNSYHLILYGIGYYWLWKKWHYLNSNSSNPDSKATLRAWQD